MDFIVKNIPAKDIKLFKELFKRLGWQVKELTGKKDISKKPRKKIK